MGLFRKCPPCVGIVYVPHPSPLPPPAPKLLPKETKYTLYVGEKDVLKALIAAGELPADVDETWELFSFKSGFGDNVYVSVAFDDRKR